MKIFLGILVLSIIFLIYEINVQYQNKLKKEELLINLGASFFFEEINRIIDKNKYNLLEERRRLKDIDAYGNENLDRWFGNPPLCEHIIKDDISKGCSKFKEGIPYFWLKVIVKKFDGLDLFFEKWKYYKLKNPFIIDEILCVKRELNIEDWYAFIASLIEKKCKNLMKDSEIDFNNNYKKGIEFEDFCSSILRSKGWKVEITPTTGDQGVDLIASIEDVRLCIQCKDHEKPISNKAVQEVYAGKKYWLGSHAILISRSGFTKSAHKLAISNKVILLNEFELENIENIIY